MSVDDYHVVINSPVTAIIIVLCCSFHSFRFCATCTETNVRVSV